MTIEELIIGLSKYIRGTLDEKISLAFNVYDLRSYGYISREDIMEFLRESIPRVKLFSYSFIYLIYLISLSSGCLPFLIQWYPFAEDMGKKFDPCRICNNKLREKYLIERSKSLLLFFVSI